MVSKDAMPAETALSIALLGCFLWALSHVIPRAWATRDPLALASALLTALIALAAFLLIGVGVGTPAAF